MKQLQPSEIKLIGEWSMIDGKMVANETCERISDLTSGVLQKIGYDESGWDILYKDPNDGRFWELVYPQSHMHGGGPPQLVYISADDAKTKYDIASMGM